MARNPFLDSYAQQMQQSFGDSWGVEGDEFGGFLADQQERARRAYHRQNQNRQNMNQGKFFANNKFFSPDALQARYDRGDFGPPGRRGNNQGPGGGGPPPPGGGGIIPDNTEWTNVTDPEAIWRKHTSGLGFDNTGQGNFDDWLKGQYQEADMAYREHIKTNPNETFGGYLRGAYTDPMTLRQRFFSMDPRRRGDMSQNYVGPGRTVMY